MSNSVLAAYEFVLDTLIEGPACGTGLYVSMASVPIERYTADERRLLARHLNLSREAFFGPRRRWDLTLFLLGERPACRLMSTRELISPRGVAELRRRPEAFARSDYVGQLLQEFDIPYSLRFPRRLPDTGSSLTGFYYIASDTDRFAKLPDPYSADPETYNSPAQQTKIGQFLGYPDDAIDAHPAEEGKNGDWMNHLAPSRIEAEAKALLDEVHVPDHVARYEVLDIVLPYTPPPPSYGTAEQHLENAARCLEAGLRADTEYGIRTLAFLLSDSSR